MTDLHVRQTRFFVVLHRADSALPLTRGQLGAFLWILGEHAAATVQDWGQLYTPAVGSVSAALPPALEQ